MLIELKNCELRPWKPGDEQSLVKNANSKKVWDNVRDYFPHPYTQKDAEEWIAKNHKIDPATNLAIVVDGNAVGGIGIMIKDDVSRINAEIGYWLGEEYWNRNIMTEAVDAMIDYTFSNFNVIRIYAEVFEKNHASRKVLQKAGFLEEAILRFSVIKNNEIMDSYVYSVLRD